MFDTRLDAARCRPRYNLQRQEEAQAAGYGPVVRRAGPLTLALMQVRAHVLRTDERRSPAVGTVAGGRNLGTALTGQNGEDTVTSPTVAPQTPSPVRERIAALDALRGIAVGGILLANVTSFFGTMFLGAEQAAALPTAAIDPVVSFLEHVLVEGKFYSIFSLLFGIGFGVQLSRGGDVAVSRFRRRLRILLAIGTVHAVLVWYGDILMLYALLGFTLPWFARRSDDSLLRWTVGLLAAPTAIYLVIVAATGSLAHDVVEFGEGIPPEILQLVAPMGTGGVTDAFIGNLVFLVGRWFELFSTVRFAKVLGMFILGLWLVRRGIALDPAAHRATLVRWRRLGWTIGLPANVLAAWAYTQWAYMPASLGGLLGVVGQAIGFPLLAIGYAATLTLLVVDGRRVMGAFAHVGRMALTNYLSHSIVCVVLAYGFGFGLFWRVGASTVTAIALGIFLVQIPLSAWWLGRYQFGPVEWIWRRLTYRQPLPIRRA